MSKFINIYLTYYVKVELRNTTRVYTLFNSAKLHEAMNYQKEKWDKESMIRTDHVILLSSHDLHLDSDGKKLQQDKILPDKNIKPNPNLFIN